MSSKPKETKTTTQQTSGPLAAQLPYWTNLWGKTGSAMDATNNQPFGGEFIAGPTGTQQDGLSWLKSVAPGTNFGAADLKTMGQRIASGEFLDVNNPVFQNAATAAIDPLRRQFTETVLPGITDAAIKGGAYGGTAQEDLKLRASNDFTRAAGDVTSKMALQNLETQSKLLPNAIPMLQAGIQGELAPANTLLQAGGIEQNWLQQALQNELLKYQNQLEAPWFGLDKAAQILSAGGFKDASGTSVSTQPAPDKATQWLQGGLGVAGMLGSLMMPGMGLGLPGILGGLGGAGASPFGPVNVLGAAGGMAVPTFF